MKCSDHAAFTSQLCRQRQGQRHQSQADAQKKRSDLLISSPTLETNHPWHAQAWARQPFKRVPSPEAKATDGIQDYPVLESDLLTREACCQLG